MNSLQSTEHTAAPGDEMNPAPEPSNELAQFEAEERARLGLDGDERQQWAVPEAKAFTRAQRDDTTVLVSGLTLAQDTFLQAAMRGQGYDVLALDCPDNDALRVGKEFGNRGQCNPTYFTVGNLVKYLQDLRDSKGMAPRDIIDKYVFITAGGCGPCRFSMYITEYRKALRDAGFEGFRVLVASQTDGTAQAINSGGGVDITAGFFMAIMKAFTLGDILNALMYRIRPYEVRPGATDETITRCRAIIVAALENRTSILRAMWRVRKELAAIEVDRTQIKPRTAIIGEFWAMTTEGDGNYRLQRFLEGEGSEVDIQLLINWMLYLNWEVRYDTKIRAGLRGADEGERGLSGVKTGLRLFATWAVDRLGRLVFYSMARFMGLRGYQIPDMDELADITHKHYNNNIRGGEGHMEVGKLISNVVHNKVNMTVSVKPFGCMPSSGVSDGIQSAITELYPQAIFLPIETSGDGAVNVYSRIQMQLFKAKQRAQEEVDEALGNFDLTMEQVRGYIGQHPRLSHSLYRSPHSAGCTAADLIHDVARRMGRQPLRPAAAAAN